MIKALIAEDEHLEKKAIKFYLNNNYKEKIKIAAEVSNGEEAVLKALEHNVDLLLLDIKMPKLNGLEAAERLKAEKSDLEIIILTAHSEFDYAKRAIKIGVSDYLVKPYVESDFTEVLDNAIQKIETGKKELLEKNELTEKLKKITPILEKEIILNIIYNTKSSLQKFMEHKKLLGISGNNYCFITMNYDNKAEIKNKLYKRAAKELEKMFGGVIAYNGMINSIFLLIDNNLEEKLNSKTYQEFEKEIKNKADKKRTLEFVKSSIADDFKKISDIYNETRDNIKDIQLSINNYPYQSEKKIFAKIIDKNEKLAIKEFNQIYNYLLKEDKNNLEQIKSFLKRFLVFLNRRLMEYYDKNKSFLEMQKIEKEINLIKKINILKIYFENIIKKLINNLSGDVKEEKIEIIEMVKEYIQKNYSKDINLEDLADYIAFSKYYLSKLFKEVEGINYKDYLIKVRMEEAKKRLRNGDKIKVVACEVGYSDRNYFSRAFKKYTGISPGKFQ